MSGAQLARSASATRCLIALAALAAGSADASAQTPPQNLAATVAGSVLTLTWQPPPAPTGPVLGYQIEAGLNPGANAVLVPLGDVRAFSTTAPDGVFFVRVRAATAAGLSSPSNEVRVVIGQGGPPGPPLSLTSSVAGTTITLQWTENPSGAPVGSYVVQAGSAPGLSNIGSAALAASSRSLVVPNVPSGTYYLRVVAANAAGASPPSNEVVATVQSVVCAPPGAPTGLAATTPSGGVALTWTAPASGGAPTGYRLDVGSASGATNLASVALPLATSLATAAPNGTYFARVVATNACGVSGPSNEVSFTVGVAVPSMRGTWDGVVANHPGSFGHGPIRSFVLRLDAEPPSDLIHSIGLWTDNLGCTNSLVQAFYFRGALVISSESLRCNDGDFTMTVTGVSGNVLSGTCRGNCTFQMRKR